ncbi:MAG: hypothetical protein M9921_11600 [Fimbriimonadaceae bacterium]|nr:hypothetical protein [Fimbriimonadaceae bacterium]
MQQLGLNAVGMRVNSLDFAKLPRGALWLKDGHFLVFEAAKEDRFLVFDPIPGTVQERPLPDDVQFTADVLVVRRSQRNGAIRPLVHPDRVDPNSRSPARIPAQTGDAGFARADKERDGRACRQEQPERLRRRDQCLLGDALGG